MDFQRNLTEPSKRFLTRISRFLNEQRIEAYLVGGFLRDVLLGRETADLDIAVAGDALEIAQKVATALGGKYIPLDEINGVARVVLVRGKAVREPWQLDFSALKGTLEQDLAQRDFTINAMATDLNQWAKSHELLLFDPLNGWQDFRQGVIRVTSDEAFKFDAARLLRAVRLAAELGFSIDKKTEMLIQRDAHLIALVTGERIREELLKLLAVPQSDWLLP